ncbi:hypothetical protein BZL30_8666 [Mycobacterium kansasii]|uniref:Uncharacterized protein n=1 Tax=Mycobacterium kansasii TaxID=1768 RepID=A0A1V3WG56_MYCKA|nr:hypothetical protein BZL30_8666 [Mycobacterium kansasii]
MTIALWATEMMSWVWWARLFRCRSVGQGVLSAAADGVVPQ